MQKAQFRVFTNGSLSDIIVRKSLIGTSSASENPQRAAYGARRRRNEREDHPGVERRNPGMQQPEAVILRREATKDPEKNLRQRLRMTRLDKMTAE
jgi:hypothetical protein